jgi:RNA polymerase sporulation-specific sigma factor
LNTYISLDGTRMAETEGQEGLGLAELLTGRTELSPEELFLDKERVIFLEKAIEEELSDFEKQALDLYMTGMSYTQIAKVLGRDEKATDNALGRARAKVREVLKRSQM